MPLSGACFNSCFLKIGIFGRKKQLRVIPGHVVLILLHHPHFFPLGIFSKAIPMLKKWPQDNFLWPLKIRLICLYSFLFLSACFAFFSALFSLRFLTGSFLLFSFLMLLSFDMVVLFRFIADRFLYPKLRLLGSRNMKLLVH